jgi:hypothetical protein
MGVGSEVYQPVKMGRKAIGCELKPSYYRQAVRNLQSIDKVTPVAERCLFDDFDDPIDEEIALAGIGDDEDAGAAQ